LKKWPDAVAQGGRLDSDTNGEQTDEMHGCWATFYSWLARNNGPVAEGRLSEFQKTVLEEMKAAWSISKIRSAADFNICNF
jgi:hypothetical protein